VKIDSIKATPVRVPYRKPAAMSCGTADNSTRTLIEVVTDRGIVGMGEASYAFPADIVEHEFAPRILGLDPRERYTIQLHCLPRRVDHGTPMLKARLAAWGGLEIALWDILAKSLELPLYRVLGGAARERAPFVSYSYSDSNPGTAAEEMARTAREQIASSGASLFEFKLGHHSVEVDIDTVRAVRAALNPSVALAVDVNQAYSIDDARRLLRAVGPLLDNIEEPTASLAEMQSLYEEFHVPISTHLCDLTVLRHYPGIQGIVPTLDVIGGVGALMELLIAARQFGKQVWLRSHAEVGVAWAAMVHVGMAFDELRRPAQCLIDLMEDDLIEGPTWHVRDGSVRAPELPGLGVTPDREALARYHDVFKRLGESNMFPPAL
jgi:glucarate dehydratase